MIGALRALLGRRQAPAAPGRARLVAAEWPAVVYAIGDVHGCLDELLQLERLIAEDASGIGGERWLVTLGDYIDRGPRSAEVVAHLMEPAPAGFRRVALAGNHEQLLLDFLADPVGNAHWLDFGGLDTARSYGMRARPPESEARRARAVAAGLRSLIPEAHIEFLRELPVSLSLPGHHFVHAGLRPGIPMTEQAEDDLMWIREPFLELERAADEIVVHGHTPAATPEERPWRIGIDTAAFASGHLTAARLSPGGAPAFLSTGT